MTALSARDVHVRLGRSEAVRGASFDVRPGWTAIVGPNGAGKSTLLRALAGVQPLDAGAVRLDGRPLGQWPARERARRIAWLDQAGEAAGDLSVRDVVALGRLPVHGLFGTPSAADDAAVEAALRAVEAEPLQARRLHDLSGGERQRVLLARALAVGAPLVLLDEPSAHLDPPHQVLLAGLVRQQVRSGAAVVSVLHDLSLALRADRLAVMAGGRVVAEGAADDTAMHAALADVFGGAVRVGRFEDRWIAVPHLP